MFILAYITDFYFQAKVSETARQVGATIKIVTSPDKFGLELKQVPALVIIDLAAAGIDSPGLIARSKCDAPDIPVIAFGAHVDAELLGKAAKAGADNAMPRSKFSKLLPEILETVSDLR